MRVAVLGLGLMGLPMARRLCQAGLEVHVWNRTISKAEVLLPLGATVHLTPALAVAQADLTITMLEHGGIVESVVFDHGVAQAMRKDSLLVDMSSIEPAQAKDHAKRLQALNIRYLDAPVSGGQAGAQNGALTVMCGGDSAAFDAVKPVGMAFSKAFTLMGASGAGQLTKMVNQICIAGLVQGLSEAVAFGQKAGLDVNQVLDVIGKGAAQSWQLDNRGKTMVADKFDFGFAVDWMRKDLGLVLDEAKRNGSRLPVTALVDQFYADVQALGGQRWDTSSLIKRLK